MSQISSFFSVLLSIQVTFFGIISAAVFVLLQVSYSSLPRHSLRLLLNKELALSVILSLLTVFCTAVSALLLSLPRHDFLSKWNFGLRPILMSQWTPAILMILTIFSAFCFAWIVIRNFSVLHPQKLLLQFQGKVRAEDIRLFLYKQNGINPPSSPSELVSIPGYIKKKMFHPPHVNPPDLSEEDKISIGKSIEEGKARFEADKIRFKELKVKAEKIEDPLDLLTAISITAIRTSDFETLREIRNTVRELTNRLLLSITPLGHSIWDPDKDLASNWARHVCGFVSTLMEIGYKEGLPSASLILIAITEECTSVLIKTVHYQSVIHIMNYWKQVAQHAIGKNRILFIWIMKQYRDIGFIALEKELIEIRDHTFMDLGWLGETLLDTIDFRDKPLMMNREYSTEQDELVEVLLRFGSEYSSNYAMVYPVSYFDALHVLCLKVIKLRGKAKESTELVETVSSCMSKIASFVEPALRASNPDGAALAVLRLSQWYQALQDNGLKDDAKTAIDYLTTIGCTTARFEASVSSSSLMSGSIIEYIVKILSTCPYPEVVQASIHEGVIKSASMPEHQRVWDFVRRLGKQMMTNFGFRFDWNTGKVYS